MSTTYYEDGTKKETKGNKNPILDAATRLLTNPNNKAPAATFIQRQKRLNRLVNER